MRNTRNKTVTREKSTKRLKGAGRTVGITPTKANLRSVADTKQTERPYRDYSVDPDTVFKSIARKFQTNPMPLRPEDDLIPWMNAMIRGYKKADYRSRERTDIEDAVSGHLLWLQAHTVDPLVKKETPPGKFYDDYSKRANSDTIRKQMRWLQDVVRNWAEYKAATERLGVPAKYMPIAIACGHTPGVSNRNLDYRSEEPMTAKELQLYAALIYAGKGRKCNEFSQAGVSALADRFPAAQFYLALEGSAAIYVTGQSQAQLRRYTEDQIKATTKADEVDIVGNELRVWWD